MFLFISVESQRLMLCFPSIVCYSLIQNVKCVSDVPRVHTMLKLLTGVYLLQVNRTSFIQNNIDATCQLYHQSAETVADFLLDCLVLESGRRMVLEVMLNIGCKLLQCPVKPDQMLQLILDSSCFTSGAGPSSIIPHTETLNMQTRRMCHMIHILRYKRPSLIPKRMRK